MLQKLTNWLRRVLYKLLNVKKISKATGIEIPDISIMAEHMEKCQTYMMGNAPYLFENGKKIHKSLNLFPTIAKEYAKLCLLDYECLITGSSRAEWLQRIHNTVLLPILEISLQWSLALGNVILKPRYGSGKLFLDMVLPSNFIPIQWEGSYLTGAIFLTQKTNGDRIYSLLEIMQYENRAENRFTIQYLSFVKDNKYAGDNNDLGLPIPLSDVPEWSDLSDSVIYTERPLFELMKPIILNNIDPNSPLGVSVLRNSFDSIEAADIAYSSLDWEIEAGQTAAFMPQDMMLQDDEGNIIVPSRIRNFYQMVRGNKVDGDNSIEQLSPALREQNIINAVKYHLQMIESHLSFTQGTFSADPISHGRATATQIKADKIETINTISATNETMVKPAIRGAMEIFNILADVLEIPESGSGEYEISIEMNKDTFVDPDARFAQALELYQNGVFTKKMLLRYSSFSFEDKEAAVMITEAERERTQSYNPNDRSMNE